MVREVEEEGGRGRWVEEEEGEEMLVGDGSGEVKGIC